MVLLPTKVFTTHSIRLTVTRYFEFEGQISNSYQTAISLQIKIICRWAGEGIKEILQVNEIYYYYLKNYFSKNVRTAINT